MASVEEYGDMDALLDSVGYGAYQHMLLAVTGFGLFADATELMLLPFLQILLVEDSVVVREEAKIVSSVVFMGMLLGAMSSGFISDSFGRRFAVLLFTFLVASAGLLSSMCSSLSTISMSRFFVGVGVAGTPAALSLFSEFVPRAQRGKHLVQFMFFFSIGATVEVLIVWLTVPSLGWRSMVLASAAPSILATLLAWKFLPESPRFLFAHRRYTEAIEVLRIAAEKNDTTAKLEQQLTKHPIDKEESAMRLAQPSYLKSLFTPPYLQLTVLLTILFAIMAFVYYVLVQLCVLLEYAHSDGTISTNMIIDALISNFAEIPGLFLALHLLDRIGRRRTISLLFTLCGVSLLLFPILSGNNHCRIALTFLMRAFALGFNQSLWIFAAECFPTHIRAGALGVCTSGARVGAIVTPYFANGMLPSESMTMVVCAVACFTSAGLVLCVREETGGRALKD